MFLMNAPFHATLSHSKECFVVVRLHEGLRKDSNFDETPTQSYALGNQIWLGSADMPWDIKGVIIKVLYYNPLGDILEVHSTDPDGSNAFYNACMVVNS